MGLYDFSYNYLVKWFCDTTKKTDSEATKVIDTYLEPDDNNIKSINTIMRRMCISLQNSQYKPNVIKFEKNEERFRTILFDFNPQSILKCYQKSEQLLDKFKEEFNINVKKKTWSDYSIGIIEASKFFSKFKDEKDFFDYADSYGVGFPYMLAQRHIKGMKFALACDFLKEIGYTNLVKPDIHMIEITKALTGKTEDGDCDDAVCFDILVKTAKKEGVQPYKLDKVLWLICSGKFYKDKEYNNIIKKNKATKSKNTLRKNFIKALKNNDITVDYNIFYDKMPDLHIKS